MIEQCPQREPAIRAEFNRILNLLVGLEGTWGELKKRLDYVISVEVKKDDVDKEPTAPLHHCPFANELAKFRKNLEDLSTDMGSVYERLEI